MADGAEALHAAAPPLRQLGGGLDGGGARHCQQEARIDALVTRLDAIATEDAGRGPLMRRLRSLAMAKDVDDAGDDFAWAGFGNTRRFDARAGLDTFAATRAGVQHLVDAPGKCRLKRDLAHPSRPFRLRLRNRGGAGHFPTGDISERISRRQTAASSKLRGAG